MHKKYSIVLIVLLLCIPFFISCWDSQDINEKDLTTTVAVGKTNDDYEFVVEIANLAPISSSDEQASGTENFTVVHAKGESYADARLNLDQKLDKPIFLGTVRMLVLSDDMAKDGIEEYIYRLRNLHEYRKALYIVTTSEDLVELLETHKGKQTSAGHNIEAIISKLDESGKTIIHSASTALEHLSRKYICFLLPDVSLIDDQIALTGYSIIKKGKLAGLIVIDETKGINFILNDNVKYVYVVPFGEHNATVEVALKKRKIKPTYKNKKISFLADFSFEAAVKYLDINDGFGLAEQAIVYRNLKDQLDADIDFAIKASQQKYKCDYLEFDEFFRIKYPNEFKKMDWYEAYLDANVTVKTQLTVDPGGEYEYDPQTKWKNEE
jgi:spore germination protein KC